MSEKIIVADLGTGTVRTIEHSYEDDRPYGRRLVADLFKEFVPDGTDRFSPDNIIVIAPGLFAGNPAPSATRMLVATIEAADKGIQYCNTTGNMPQKLGSLGIAAVVIKGVAPQKGTVLRIDANGVYFDVCSGLAGRATTDIIRDLRGRFGADCAVTGNSIAGEMGMPLSTFFCTYPEGEPEYHCPRNGFGDVWGAKNLKAVVVCCDSYFSRECADPERFRKISRRLTRIITEDEICGGALPSYGSITIMKILQDRGSIAGLSKETEEQDGRADMRKPETKAVPIMSGTSDTGNAGVPVRSAYAERPGHLERSPNSCSNVRSGRKLNKVCAHMCVIGCLNRHVNVEGRMYSSPSQVETQAAIERCFGIDDYDLADRIHTASSEIGIAATEFVTACKTYARTAGIENGEEYLAEWLDDVRRGTLTGRVIASRTYGVASLYKDMDLEDWIDRKAVQDEGLYNVRLSTTYPGLAGLTALELLYAQIFVLENLGLCIFTSFALLGKTETFELLAEMFEARTGCPMTGEKLVTQAYDCIRTEREYHEQRWMAEQKSNIPPFTRVLYRYFDDRNTPAPQTKQPEEERKR